MPQSNMVSIDLSEEEIVEIVRLLDFTRLASKIALTNQHLPPAEVATYTRNMANAKDIGDNLIAALDIGNVDKDKVN